MTSSREKHGVRYDTGPTVAATVNGVGAAWNGGVFKAADPDVLTLITDAASNATVVDYNGMDLTCGPDNALAALAAIISVNPGRAVITQAPQSLLDHLAAGGYPHASLTGGPRV